MASSRLLLRTVLTIFAFDAINAQSVWGSWKVDVPCTKDCGFCGNMTMSRTCQDKGCPCKGESTYTGPCGGPKMCGFPLTSCCKPSKVISGVCGPTPPNLPDTSLVPVPECCPGGTWSAWSEWNGGCPQECGIVGVSIIRTRVCTSLTGEPSCPCSGSDIETKDCVNANCPPLPSPKCCLATGIWSEWFETKRCNRICGSCGYGEKRRTCLSEADGCPCIGDSTYQGPCAIAVCNIPNWNLCCDGFVPLTDPKTGMKYCGPLAQFPLTYENPTKCCTNPDGNWNSWSEWTPCSHTCGLCGIKKKTRTCESAKYGCPCKGPSSDVEFCETVACPGDMCCAGDVKKTSQGATCEVNFGYSSPPTDTCCPSLGIWSEWTVSVPCNDTCGTCGYTEKYRTCISDLYGCPCAGSANYKGSCAQNVCLFPRTSCCPGFTKMINSKEKLFYCGPIVGYPVDLSTGGCCRDGFVSPFVNPVPDCQANDCGHCMHATYNRTCASEKYGCPCKLKQQYSVSCSATPCNSTLPCCEGVLQKDFTGAQFCGTPPTTACDLTCCPPSGGIWSEWTATAPCSETCGGCGTQTLKRTCLSDPNTCPCSGIPEIVQNCNFDVCLFPKISCCPGFTKMAWHKNFICGPKPADPDPQLVSTCCRNRPVWGEWTWWTTTCTANCGGCSNIRRTRECLTESQGCPCGDDKIEIRECNFGGTLANRYKPCTISPTGYKSQCCAPYTLVGGVCVKS
ncbi:unnamed protein product [Caenorhabditis auriculariae]|uniref:Uncharacterized protein n=1 Tax=Caenorhabditis auriculariae TaxID=2777116 RepID=A0A8S1GU12_9PELO|nr:unnamed protein product [Caenorhabditis auriculariae]